MNLTKDAQHQVIRETAKLFEEIQYGYEEDARNRWFTHGSIHQPTLETIKKLERIGSTVDSNTAETQIRILDDVELAAYAKYCMRIWAYLEAADFDGACNFCD